jgi:hypothetical protein
MEPELVGISASATQNSASKSQVVKTGGKTSEI